MSPPKHSQANGRRTHVIFTVRKEGAAGERATGEPTDKAIAKLRYGVTRSAWGDGNSDGEEGPNTRTQRKIRYIFDIFSVDWLPLFFLQLDERKSHLALFLAFGKYSVNMSFYRS